MSTRLFTLLVCLLWLCAGSLFAQPAEQADCRKYIISMMTEMGEENPLPPELDINRPQANDRAIATGSTTNGSRKKQGISIDSLTFQESFNFVKQEIKCKLNSRQTAAMVSLVYSVGSGNFEDSYLHRLLNYCKLDRDRRLIEEEMKKWIYKNNNLNDPLLMRRKKEAQHFYE